MVEHHVYDAPKFQTDQSELPFGGSLWVCKPRGSKLLIIFGQNESIFKQYKCSKSAWCIPDGQFAVIPKDEGHGLMVSTFISRDFGFGMSLTKEQLDSINIERRGKKVPQWEICKKNHYMNHHSWNTYSME
jgi:hypothetical protein